MDLSKLRTGDKFVLTYKNRVVSIEAVLTVKWWSIGLVKASDREGNNYTVMGDGRSFRCDYFQRTSEDLWMGCRTRKVEPRKARKKGRPSLCKTPQY